MNPDTLAYCPSNSAHGKWLNYGGNCPCRPRTTFLVHGPAGTVTESFDSKQVALLERMGFIQYNQTFHYDNGSMNHHYTPKEN